MRHLSSALDAAGQRIREHLDTERVLRAAVEALHRTLECRRTSAWVGVRGDVPRLAWLMGEPKGGPAYPPAAVADAATRGRASSNQLVGDLALPLVAATGVMGVLYLERSQHPGLEGWESEERAFAEGIARETGLALQAAHLYERALSEKEKSQAILARVADAVVVTDPTGAILQWNPAAERTFDDDAEGALGRRCSAVLALHRGDTELACEGACPLIDLPGADSTLGEELWRRRRNGDRQPLLATAQAVRDGEGRISEVVHSFRDITRLKEADEAKALFLATASHELKTPLTVIQGFAETLLRTEATSDLREEALRAIERRAIELDAIVNRLLLSSRIEAGRMTLDLSDIDLGPIVAERVAAFSQATGQPVRFRTGADLPRVVADLSAVSIVVDHLLDNAIKYSPGREPVDVAIDATDRLEIVVSDRGIGMDADQVLHCFDKFWQGDSSNDRRFGGTGIGLFIVRSLVESMGGSVQVRSAPGEGSAFTVSLVPVGATASPPIPPAPESERTPQPGVGETSVIREFMRQMGVPVRRES